MKVILDTNIWLSALFWDGEARKIIEKAEKKEFEVIVSEEILSEIVNVLNRESKFQNFLVNLELSIEELVRKILSTSALIQTRTKFDLIKDDPKDNIILEAAFDGKADYIVSYDKHILDMLEFREIKILEPKEFLKII